MAYNRTNIKKGRGQVVVGGVTLLAKDQVRLNWLHSMFKISTANSGNRDTRDSDRMLEIRLTPAGEVTAGMLAVLYPHLSKAYGAAACGTSDAAAVVYFEAGGEKIEVHNSVVYQMPALRLRGGETAFGELVIHGLVKNQTEPAAAGSYFTRTGSIAYPGDAAFLPANVKAGIFSAAWGSTAPWSEFWGDDGFSVEFGTEMVADGPDGLTRDYRVCNQIVRVTARPKGVAVEDVQTIEAARFQGTGAPIGSTSLGATANSLNIFNSDLYFRLYSASLEPANVIGNPRQDVVGDLTWYADRTQTTGADNPVAYVGVAAPA